MHELDDYQIEAAKFLAERNHALLAHEMGLGKSACAIRAADMVSAFRILIICPAVARINWKREFNAFSIFDRDFVVCFGLLDRPGQCSIVSYEYATRNHSRLVSMQWDLVIVDECHYIKETEAKRTVKIYGKDGIIRSSKRMWNLSGTPAPNHVGELWPMLFTFGATTLPYEKFINRYCKTRPTFYGGTRRLQITGTRKEKAPEIKKILEKIMLRRTKEEVLKDLPPIKYGTYFLQDIELEIDYDKEKYNEEKSLVTRALQNANDEQGALILEGIAHSVPTLRRIDGIKKAHQVAELVLFEMESGAYSKKVLFAWHREVIEILKEKLKKLKPVVIYGGVSNTARQDAIDNFQNDPETKIFIGQLLAAGTAITLTAASYIDLVEEDYVPGVNAQAIMRVHRRGQLNPVFVRFYAVADTIGEKITRIHRNKAEELTVVFDNKGEENAINN